MGRQLPMERITEALLRVSRDPFDFFPDRYNDQLVAGYSKTTSSGGLRVYMPDYNKISKPLTP